MDGTRPQPAPDRPRSRVVLPSAQIPSGSVSADLGVELFHPEHARQAEYSRRDDPEDRVRRRAGGRRIRPVDLVPLGLERPVVLAEELGDMANGAVSVSGSARPSTTRSMDGSLVLLVPMTHRLSAARSRAFRVPSPATMWSAPSIQNAITGMRCGRPSGRVVASQLVLGVSGFASRSSANSQDGRPGVSPAAAARVRCSFVRHS